MYGSGMFYRERKMKTRKAEKVMESGGESFSLGKVGIAPFCLPSLGGKE